MSEKKAPKPAEIKKPSSNGNKLIIEKNTNKLDQPKVPPKNK